MTTKPTNPKDIVGIRKAPMSTVSAAVMAEVGVAMLEGACKYGRHNYRAVGVRSSVYYDGTMRHLMAWWDGEDVDADSGMSHVTKAITSLVVLRDAMIQGKCTDDRPPRSASFYEELNRKAGEIMDKYAGRNPRHYTIDDDCANVEPEPSCADPFDNFGKPAPVNYEPFRFDPHTGLNICLPVASAEDEPASQIDDESPRAAILGQNGEMADEVYSAVDGVPRWDDSPDNATFLAQDQSGKWYWYSSDDMVQGNSQWFGVGNYSVYSAGGEDLPGNPNWRNTLQARPQKEA